MSASRGTVVEYGGHGAGLGQRVVRLCGRHDTAEARERWVGSRNPNVRRGRHFAACDVCAQTATERLMGAQSLDELRDVLEEIGPDLGNEATAAPTFGGPAPADTEGVWSWDATRLLVGGGHARWGDGFRLVRRIGDS